MAVKLAPYEWVRQTREDKGIRQVDIATDSAEMAPDLKISQSHLSKIEKGHSPLEGLGPRKLDVLRRLLGVTPDEWLENTGLELVTRRETVTAPASGRKGPPVPPRLAPVDIPLEIPPTLQAAIDKYGEDYPEFKDERNLRIITSIYRLGGGGEFAPKDWLEILLANRPWLVKN